MLSLNEKMIRGGKPIGLPYKGSKKKISKKVVEIIKQNFGTDKTVYDLFGGGGAMTCELTLNGFDVVYNELDKSVVDMFKKALTADSYYLKSLIISREEFYSIREKEIKTVDDELKLLINSFGNNRKNYLYNRDIADAKYNLAKQLLERNQYRNYRKQPFYKLYKQKFRQLERLQQLQQLQQLERLQQLQITNKSYEDFSGVEDAILYLDPPYEGTSGYDNVFDSQAFYDWAFEMAKHNIVLISSYTISDNRFSVAYEFPTAKSTFQGGGGQGECEKLFMPIWQLEECTSEQLTLF